jgi:hypothetical protein
MAERKVKFFRAVHPDGTRLAGGFPAAKVLKSIDEMVVAGTAELKISLGQRLVAKSLGKATHGHHIVFYRVSSDDLPMLYENGEFRPLEEVIAAGVDIAEPAHFAFFPNGVVAHLYNHQGPKQAQLASYLLQTMDTDVIFDPIARDDVLASIANAGGVSLFKFRARAEDLSRFDGMHLEGMRQLANDFPVADVEIILRARTDDQRRALGGRIQGVVQRATQAGRRGYVENAKVALKDTDALSEGREVDILQDVIVLTQSVDTMPGQRRYLEEDSAMSALEDAYRKVRARLDD